MCIYLNFKKDQKKKDNYDDGDEDDDAPWNCSWDAKLYIDVMLTFFAIKLFWKL